MNHAYYNSDVEAFLANSDDEIVGKLNKAGTAFASQWTITTTSWDSSINILKESFRELLEHNNSVNKWHIFFETPSISMQRLPHCYH